MFDIKIFLKKDIVAILIFVGLLLFSVLSFYEFSYNGNFGFSPKQSPNFFFLSLAIILLICFVIKSLPLVGTIAVKLKQYSYSIEIDMNHKITIKQGDISSYRGDLNKAVLLPANTSFDDECIADKNSALGKYLLENYPGRIEGTKKLIIDRATNKNFISPSKKNADLGDTVLLPKYDGEKVNILISAVTQNNPGIGIQADAIGVISSIKNALSLCSENKYSSVTLPIIGSGHGGMKPNISLMLICIQYFLSLYHSQNHHVKELEIIVFDRNKRLKNDIDEVVGCIKKLISKKR